MNVPKSWGTSIVNIQIAIEKDHIFFNDSPMKKGDVP